MTPHLTTFKKPENIIAFRRSAAYVVVFPYARELTQPEWARIDTARRFRFFLYASSDAPMPPGISGTGTIEDYPVGSLRFAIDRSTRICPEILPLRQRSRQELITALLGLDASGSNEDHRGVVMVVTDRSFGGDDWALQRPSPA